MSVAVDVTGAAGRLLKADNILLICHKNPDGDTLGSAGALQCALEGLGKKVAVACSDPVHPLYSYMNLQLFSEQFKPEYIVAVDIASVQLFGEKTAVYTDKINLGIDHHSSNSGFAEYSLLDDDASATCEIIFAVIIAMGVLINKQIADCLYTGIATDTGCFKFPNTSSTTFRVAARLFELGADTVMINEIFFENKSKQRIAIEQLALSHLEYHYDGKCALVCLMRDEIDTVGANDTDLDGITSMPRAIEGVVVGITIRQQVSGSYKISVRTKVGLDASAICIGLGGGGHKQAAGCEIMGSAENTKGAILAEVEKNLVEAKMLFKDPVPEEGQDEPPQESFLRKESLLTGGV